MSHHAQELLALLKYIQVNQRNLHQGIICKMLDAVDMLLAKYAELILAGICLGENLVVVLVAAGLNLLAAHTHQVVDLLAYRSKLLGVFCREWIEVVVHVLLDWVKHTAKRVEELLVAVGTQVEPGVALDGNLHR